MSYQLMGWAAEQKTGSPTRKAVLLALANRTNHDTGRCDPSVERIAEETELGRTAVKTALRDLVEMGLLTRERKRRADGSLGTYRYSFPRSRGDLPGTPGDPRPEPGGDPLNQEVPEPGSSEGANAPSSRVVDPRTPIDDHVYASDPQIVESMKGGGERVWSVDRKPVKWEHAKLAVDVLSSWNELTGQQLRSKDWLNKIVMRIREYPEATLEDHRYLIERNLEHPWWKGAPTPSVIYGSGAQFERSVMTARHEEDEGDRIERIVNAVMERGAA